MKYQVIPNSRGPKRLFSITIGLFPGYPDPGDEFNDRDPDVMMRNVRNVILRWIKRRAAARLPILSGILTGPDNVLYGWPTEEGSRTGEEPVAVFAGELSPLHHRNTQTSDVEAMLNELASEIGQVTRQIRLYITFDNEMWILQAKGAATPVRTVNGKS